jgi:hypothetical protein
MKSLDDLCHTAAIKFPGLTARRAAGMRPCSNLATLHGTGFKSCPLIQQSELRYY